MEENERKDNVVENVINSNELSSVIDISVICRICANSNEKLIAIYSDDGLSNDLSNKINLYLPIKVSEDDELPLYCCWECANSIISWHSLVVTSVTADTRLRNYYLSQKDTTDLSPSSYSPAEISFESSEENIKTESENDSEPEEVKSTEKHFQNNLSDAKEASSSSVKKESEHSYARTLIKNALANKENVRRNRKISKTEEKSAYAVKDKQCSKCDLKFNVFNEFRNHMLQVHKTRVTRHRRKANEVIHHFFCDICEKGFSRKFDMEKHKISKHKTPVASKSRRQMREALEEFKLPTMEGKKSYYQCDVCSKVIKGLFSFKMHKTIHSGAKKFICDICGKEFRLKYGLRRHLTQFHQQIRNYSCDLCDKKFASASTRNEHMNVHLDHRPYCCDICGKSFKQRSSLFVHKMFHSDANLRFPCEVCGKKFRRIGDLKKHNLYHSGQKSCACSICGQTFTLMGDLVKHQRKHEGASGEQKEWVCSECGSKFNQERYLKSHMRSHLKKPNALAVNVDVHLLENDS